MIWLSLTPQSSSNCFGDLLVDLAVLPDHEGEPLRVPRRALGPRSWTGRGRSSRREEAGRGRPLHEAGRRDSEGWTDPGARMTCPLAMRSTTRARARGGINPGARAGAGPRIDEGQKCGKTALRGARPGTRRSSPAPATRARAAPRPGEPARAADSRTHAVKGAASIAWPVTMSRPSISIRSREIVEKRSQACQRSHASCLGGRVSHGGTARGSRHHEEEAPRGRSHDVLASLTPS
jgi:hypothetical protein